MRGMSIRTIRRLKGLTQIEMAEKAGISQSSASRAESLEDGVTLGVMRAIAAALNTDLASLFQEDRGDDERVILEAFRLLSPERRRGWGDMARAVLSETAAPPPESDPAGPRS